MIARIVFKDDPLKILAGLDKGIRNKAIRIAMNKAASPVKAEVVNNAPVRHGILKKSFRIKVKNYKKKNVWVAVIGPQSKFAKNKGKYLTGEKKGQPIKHRPSAYARLVEKGTKHIRGRHFIKRAGDTAGAKFQDSMIASLKTQVELLLNKN